MYTTDSGFLKVQFVKYGFGFSLKLSKKMTQHSQQDETAVLRLLPSVSHGLFILQWECI